MGKLKELFSESRVIDGVIYDLRANPGLHRLSILRMDAEFERKHPRDKIGRFAKKHSASSPAAMTPSHPAFQSQDWDRWESGLDRTRSLESEFREYWQSKSEEAKSAAKQVADAMLAGSGYEETAIEVEEKTGEALATIDEHWHSLHREGESLMSTLLGIDSVEFDRDVGHMILLSMDEAKNEEEFSEKLAKRIILSRYVAKSLKDELLAREDLFEIAKKLHPYWREIQDATESSIGIWGSSHGEDFAFAARAAGAVSSSDIDIGHRREFIMTAIGRLRSKLFRLNKGRDLTPIDDSLDVIEDLRLSLEDSKDKLHELREEVGGRHETDFMRMVSNAIWGVHQQERTPLELTNLFSHDGFETKRSEIILQTVSEIVHRMLPKSVRAKFKFEKKEGRAEAWGDTCYVEERENPITVAHEIGHVIENLNPTIKKLARGFLAARIKDETPIHMNELTQSERYKIHEFAAKDEFFDPYCGKIYPHGSTEIISMGLQRIFESALGFHEEDPEYFAFMISILTGMHR